MSTGLVASLARPGGNLTGVSILTVELTPKRLELLSELVPQSGVIALAREPEQSDAERVIEMSQEAARVKGVQLDILKAGTETRSTPPSHSLVQLQTGALVVGRSLFDSRREQIAALAARHAVPAIYPWREIAAAGGLISYGASLTASGHQVGSYLRKNPQRRQCRPICRSSSRPGSSWSSTSSTAKALGLTVPPSILARADEVIE